MAGLTESEELLRDRVRRSLEDRKLLLESDAVAATADAAERVIASIRQGGKVLFFGNGGSSTDAGHLAAELLGRFYADRRPLPAMNLADNTAAMTAIGNDYSYDETFSRQVRALGVRGDVAVGLTTSGNSANVVRAMEDAASLGMVTVAFTGSTGGKLAQAVDLCIRVPSDDTPRVQEMCMLLGHTLCEIVERAFLDAP